MTYERRIFMKKILVPVDGSPTSEKAARIAVGIAKQFHSEILFITVVDTRGIYTYDVGGVIMLPVDNPQLTAGLIEVSSKMLDYFTYVVDCSGIDVKKKVLTGETSDIILRYADEENCDLIVMGRRGFSKIKRFFTGSVTQKVVPEASCPVLIINDEEKETTNKEKA
jgi:nucleotide-binding universal stress UspA family protein